MLPGRIAKQTADNLINNCNKKIMWSFKDEKIDYGEIFAIIMNWNYQDE